VGGCQAQLWKKNNIFEQKNPGDPANAYNTREQHARRHAASRCNAFATARFLVRFNFCV